MLGDIDEHTRRVYDTIGSLGFTRDGAGWVNGQCGITLRRLSASSYRMDRVADAAVRHIQTKKRSPAGIADDLCQAIRQAFFSLSLGIFQSEI